MFSAVLHRAAGPVAQRVVILIVLLLLAFTAGLVARRFAAASPAAAPLGAHAALLLYPLLGPPFAGVLRNH